MKFTRKGLLFYTCLYVALVHSLSCLNVEKVKKRLEEIGGLKFKKQIPIIVLSPEGFRKKIREVFTKQYSSGLMQVEEKLLKGFHLIPSDFNYSLFKRELYASNAAGFYDEKFSKALYLMRLPEEELMELALVHELRHALQDQNFSLSRLLKEKDLSFSDQNLTAIALLEGDATFTTLLYFGREELDLRQTLNPNYLFVPPPFRSIPAFLKYQLVEPYVTGFEFIRKNFKRGGWKRVFEVLKKPPKFFTTLLEGEISYENNLYLKEKGYLFSTRLGYFFYHHVLGERAKGIKTDILLYDPLKHRMLIKIEAKTLEEADKIYSSLKTRLENVEKSYKIIIVKLKEEQYDRSYTDKERHDFKH